MDNISSIMENNTSITLSCFNESEAWDYYNDEIGSSVYFSIPYNRGAVWNYAHVSCYSHIFNVDQFPEDQKNQRVGTGNTGEIICNLVGKYCNTCCAMIKSWSIVFLFIYLSDTPSSVIVAKPIQSNMKWLLARVLECPMKCT